MGSTVKITSGTFSMRHRGNNLASLMEGFVLAPATGDYTFSTRSDDSSIVYASRAPNTPLGSLVTVVELDGCCRKVQGTTKLRWNQGQAYYIQAIVKEGGGGEYLDVGMTVGGREYYPIPVAMFVNVPGPYKKPPANCALENGDFEADKTPGYKYMKPKGWTNKGGTVIVRSKNGPWGGLAAASGNYFLSTQGAGAYVEQSVCGLDASKDYHLTFAVTHRPGYGNDEKVKVTINGKTVWTADGKNGVPSNFGDIGIKFRGPASGQALICFENDSPKGDKSIFVDNVKLGVFKVNKCTCANGTPATGLACKVDKSSTCAKCNSGFQLASGGKACVPKKCGVVQNGGMEEGASAITTTYKYTKPTRWTGSKNGIVVVRSGNRPWGGLTSHSGNYFISIQGSGAYVEQKVCGLVKGTTYTVSFAATHRPGYGNDEKLKVTVDGKTVWSAAANAKNGLPDKFGTFKATFTAQGGDATIRFENDSPKATSPFSLTASRSPRVDQLAASARVILTTTRKSTWRTCSSCWPTTAVEPTVKARATWTARARSTLRTC